MSIEHLWIALAPIAAAVLGAAAVWLSMKFGHAWGLVDRPGSRKVHTVVIPRTGGLGIAAAALAAGAGGLALVGTATPVAWVGLGGVLLVVLAVGVLDDAVSLPGHYKLLALVAVASTLCGLGFAIDRVGFNPHGADAGLGIAGWLLTVPWVCGITVAIAFSDGLDGLAGGVGVIVAGTVATVALMAGQADIGVAALALAGALIGFLYFNGPWGRPGRVFMGDGGSMFLGVALAALPLLLNGREGVGTMRAMVVPAAALGVPILDAGLTLVRRRVLQRRSLFSAEDGHVHHRLLAIGLSTRHAVFLLWAVTLLAAGGSLAAAAFGNGWSTLAILVPMLGLLWLALFRTAGSVRGRDTIAAVRRHRAAGRRGKTYRVAFEEAQLRLAKASDFGEWWREACHAAEALRFASLRLVGSRRNGEPYEIEWQCEPDVDEPVGPTVDVALDVPQRRLGDGSPLKLHAKVLLRDPRQRPLPESIGAPSRRHHADLESAGERLTYFSRLLSEHGLATLDDEDRSRLAKAHKRRQAAAPSEGESITPAARELPPRDDGLPSVAIVHDFLYVRGGAEKVLEQMLEVFPHADLFSVIDFVPPGERAWLRDKPVTTSFIQRLPLAQYKHRAYLPLMPLAIEQLDVTGYDVVLSSSYCVAKGVICRPDQLHVSYCHSPVRYAWDLQTQYLREVGLTKLVGGKRRGPLKLFKNAFARTVLHYVRHWDHRSAAGVDVFLSNSDFVGRRIEKAYRRQSTTVYPPVDVSAFDVHDEKLEYYYVSSRMVPYKRIPMIVEAFTRTPERRLVVGGDGPDFERVKKIAGPNVRVVGHQKHEEHVHYMQRAKAFVFAAEEDFGIVPVEAMACGTPVICYGRGGATETVVDGVTGVHFDRQTAESLLEAVARFEQLHERAAFDSRVISRHARQFGSKRFRDELRDIVLSHWHTRSGRDAGADAPAATPSIDDLPTAVDHPAETRS